MIVAQITPHTHTHKSNQTPRNVIIWLLLSVFDPWYNVNKSVVGMKLLSNSLAAHNLSYSRQWVLAASMGAPTTPTLE